MWKFITRGFRESLEKRACRTNVYSQNQFPQDGNTKSEVKASLIYRPKFRLPNISTFTNSFGRSKKAGGTEDNDYQTKWKPKHTWTEAVGWSSALAVGWAVCQSLCLRRRLLEKEARDPLHAKLLRASETHVSHILNQLLYLHPKNILPITKCIHNNDNNQQIINHKEEYSDEGKLFGCKTAEEALKEAADEFFDKHKLTLGEFELQFGIRALDEKRYKDAIEHFTVGAELSSPGSTFNLGLCYELGLGTLVDRKKAAKYYSDAAKLGHADAMYNLGVFHAQGEGGLALDTDQARAYFIKAAKLGQTHAQRALDLEKTKHSRNEEKKSLGLDDTSYCLNILDSNSKKHISFELQDYKNTTDISLNTANNRLEYNDYKHPAKERKSSTDIFLEYLGLNQPSRIALKVAANVPTVSY